VPTRESIERHRARLGHGWGDALHCAYKRDTAKLCAYLRHPDLPLDEYKRDDLAALIDRRIGRKAGKGRKPGRIPPPDRDKITMDDVVYSAQKVLDRIRQRNGGRAPPGSYQVALAKVCQRLGDEGETVDIDERQALKMLSRGRR
jgi:hypothetical protein